MDGYVIVNVLGALLIVTSLSVMLTKSPKTSAFEYGAQSIVLVAIFITLGIITGSGSLFTWAGTATLTKVIFVPAVMLYTYKLMGSPDNDTPSAVSPVASIALVAVELLACFVAVSGINLPTAAEVKPALAVSLAHFFIGLTCIVTQRNILKQVFGYCLMENGSHVTLALLAPEAPELVEVGIATDAGFAGIIMCIVNMVVGLTPYGVLALITNVLATSDFAAILDLGKFIIFSYVAIITMFLVHLLIVAGNRLSPLTYVKKAFPVLSFAFVSRTSAGAMPLNIETQSKALGVDAPTANFAASFGMSIGQNGCAGIYPAMMATLIAPTIGIDVFDPTWVVGLIAIIVISSFGVAGVGGGATFASLIVLGTMGLPIEIVGLMASVEPLIDMGRTALNVSDSMVAGITSSNFTGGLDRQMYADPNARVNGIEDLGA